MKSSVTLSLITFALITLAQAGDAQAPADSFYRCTKRFCVLVLSSSRANQQPRKSTCKYQVRNWIRVGINAFYRMQRTFPKQSGFTNLRRCWQRKYRA